MKPRVGFDNLSPISWKNRWENTFAARELHSPKIALSLSFSSTYCSILPHKKIQIQIQMKLKSLKILIDRRCQPWHKSHKHVTDIIKSFRSSTIIIQIRNIEDRGNTLVLAWLLVVRTRCISASLSAIKERASLSSDCSWFTCNLSPFQYPF